MSAVPAALAKAFAQLGDPAVMRVAAKSIAITLALFALLGTGAYFGLADLARRFGWSEAWAGLAAAVLVPVLFWLLFRAIGIAVLQFFADDIVAAVEARHYPARAATARPLPFAREFANSLRGLLRAIGFNLLALPVALVLVFTAIGPAIVFLTVNAVLLGRELTDMAFVRHATGEGDANPVGAGERFALGLVIAAMMLVPLAGFIAPVVGAAAGTHLVLRRLERTGSLR